MKTFKDLVEGADYGRSRFTSIVDKELISDVYVHVKNALRNLGSVYGSTTDDSHGYIAVSSPGVSVEESMVDEFREIFPNVEFKIRKGNCVSFRTIGSKGWWL